MELCKLSRIRQNRAIAGIFKRSHDFLFKKTNNLYYTLTGEVYHDNIYMIM
jgi:hypothetical protein